MVTPENRACRTPNRAGALENRARHAPIRAYYTPEQGGRKMIKKLGITIAVLIVGAIIGVFVFQLNASQTEVELSRDEISNIVTDQYPGEITELELADNGNYKVEVQTQSKTYQLSVDGQSGEVLALNETSDPSAKNQETAEQDNPNTNNQEETEQEGINENNNRPNNHAKISADTAKEIALNEFSGTIAELELDEEDERLIYEIEMENNEDEATIEIDAYTGEVIMVEIDRED